MKRRFFLLTLCVLLVASTLTAPVSAAAAAPKVVQILKVTADGARLRKGPSSKYDVITSLRKGERVFYLNKRQDAFCYVRTAYGRKGYVYRGYLKAYGAARMSQVYASKSDNVKIYNKAGGKGIGTLSKNQHVLVYKRKSGWAYVKTLTGKGGYVRTKQLKKLG